MRRWCPRDGTDTEWLDDDVRIHARPTTPFPHPAPPLDAHPTARNLIMNELLLTLHLYVSTRLSEGMRFVRR